MTLCVEQTNLVGSFVSASWVKPRFYELTSFHQLRKIKVNKFRFFMNYYTLLQIEEFIIYLWNKFQSFLSYEKKNLKKKNIKLIFSICLWQANSTKLLVVSLAQYKEMGFD